MIKVVTMTMVVVEAGTIMEEAMMAAEVTSRKSCLIVNTVLER